MLDLFAKSAVWVAGVTLMIAAIGVLNDLPRRTGCFWINARKLLLLVLFAGSICIALSPAYGWWLSIYGGHLVAVAMGFWVLICLIRARVKGTRYSMHHIFSLMEAQHEAQHR